MASANNKKIVCFFNTCKAWGGGEKWHFEMALRLQKQGLHVVLCAAPESRIAQRAQAAGLEVHKVKVSNLSFFNPFKIWKIKRLLGSLNANHLILNLPSDLKTAGTAARLAGIQDIVYRRGSAIPIKNTLLNRFLFRRIVHRVLANSQETKQTILQKNQKLFPSDKISVIYNGIDLEKFDEVEVDNQPREDNRFILGNLGRLEPQKNQLFLINVMQILKQNGYNYFLRIGGDGRLHETLEQTIKNKKLENDIELVGFVDNAKNFMHNIDIFLLSSLWEGFGYVLVEAQACQKPIVAFNASSNPEVVQHKKNGLLVKANHEQDFADAIVQLGQNPEMRFLMGKNGRQYTQKHFDIKQTTHSLIDFLNAGDQS